MGWFSKAPKPPSPELIAARKELEKTDARLEEARRVRAFSENVKLTLQEIRERDNFTTEIFPRR